MKVFGICRSPRNNTTYYVLKEALDKLNNHGFETELFSCFENILVIVCIVIIAWNTKMH